MSESESEDEILDRIEAALRKIASVQAGAHARENRPDAGETLDRAALSAKLDDIIDRLRDALDNVPPRTEPGE